MRWAFKTKKNIGKTKTIIGKTEPIAPLSQIKIISFKEKSEWNLETKYNIGKTKEVKKDANEQSI